MARDGRLRIGYEWWMFSRVRVPALLLDSCASVAVVRGRGVAKLVEYDVQGVGHPRMCWTPIVTRPGS